MKKLFSMSLAILLAMFTLGFNQAVMASTLSSKTPVLVQNLNSISEATNKTSDNVKFQVVNDVRDTNGRILIAAGTPVNATITRLEEKKRIGRPTELIITGFNANVNGKPLAFQGKIEKISESRMARSIALSAVLIPLFLLMKGAAVELPAGSQVKIYPSIDYSL